MSVTNILDMRASRCRVPRVQDEEEEIIYHRLSPGSGDVPWLVFEAEVGRAHALGYVVFVIVRSNSARTWSLRCSPPEGFGEKKTMEDRVYGFSWNYYEIRLGTGPLIYRGEHHDAAPDNGPIFVKRLRGKTFEEAYAHACDVVKSWGLPPVIFEVNSEAFQKNYMSLEAKEADEAFSLWFEGL